jgi:hypothetical protein
LDVLDVVLFEEPPQPATSPAQATATSNGEYSFRVIVPPFWFAWSAGLAPPGNLDDRPPAAQDSAQVGRSDPRARIERLDNEYTQALPEPRPPQHYAVRLLKRSGVMPIFNG